MGAFILRRVLGLIPTLLVIITLAFFITRLAPGSPFSTDRAVAPEVMAALEAKYGMDQPLYMQFFGYLADLVRGDLGLSTIYLKSFWYGRLLCEFSISSSGRNKVEFSIASPI
ncbi:MAG: peptide ABC transporter permease [Myxococcota bacterium]